MNTLSCAAAALQIKRESKRKRKKEEENNNNNKKIIYPETSVHLNSKKSSLLREILVFRIRLENAWFVNKMCVPFCFRNLK